MTAERQLETARMIIATELGKDPLMRKEIRNAFEKNAVVSVLPTERGNEKIDDFHPYHVRAAFGVSGSPADDATP